MNRLVRMSKEGDASVRVGGCHKNFFAGEEVGTFYDDNREAHLKFKGVEGTDQAI